MQKLKFLAPFILEVACALPNTNYAPSVQHSSDRCITYESNSFERFFARSSSLSTTANALGENSSTNYVQSNQNAQRNPDNCNLSFRAIIIVRNKVAEVLGENRAEEFANFALRFRIVTIDPENLSTILSNQQVSTSDRSSIVGHYDLGTRLIYISSALQTNLDRLCTISHEFVHVAMDYFGGNYELANKRPLLIREGFPALIEDEIRRDFASEFGTSRSVGSYPRLRTELSRLCNSVQETVDQPCTSVSFRAFMLWPNGQLRDQ